VKHGHTRHMRWTTANGSIPSTRCERCQRPTPILIHGLGFDCCADASAPAESIQPVEITGSHCWAVIPIGVVLAFGLVALWAAKGWTGL